MIIFKGYTHIALSLVIFLTLYGLMDIPLLPGALIMTIGAILPDIDSPYSTINKFIPMGSAISIFFKHRGITHTIIAAAIWACIIWLILGIKYAGIFFLGYMLHLLGDLLTPSGVKVLYPIKKESYSLNLIRTGSPEEYLILAICLYLLLLGI